MVCSEPTEVHCSTVPGRMHATQFSVALLNRLTACIVSLQFYLWTCALIQLCCNPTPMHCSTAKGEMHPLTIQCYSAEQAHSMHCVTVLCKGRTPSDIPAAPSFSGTLQHPPFTLGPFSGELWPLCFHSELWRWSHQARLGPYAFGDVRAP